VRLIELLSSWWRALCGRDRHALSEGEQAELAALFRDRYHAFKLLLAANT
jgi:hypothetical protein